MKQRYVTLPSDCDEMTTADLREVLRMRERAARLGLQVTLQDVRTETARLLLKNRGVQAQTGNPNYIQLVGQLAETLDWLWQETQDGILLRWRTTEQKLERVREWLGPLSHGADLTFGEFRMATAVMKDYAARGDERALCVLAGLLYRPAATDGQKAEYGDRQMRRQPYDWDSFGDKEQRGRAMEPWQRQAALLWLEYFCEYLTTGDFVIDGQTVCFAPLFGSGQARTGTDSEPQGRRSGGSLQQICLTLAETHVFGTARDVDRTPLLTVMQKLLMDYQALQRLRKK